MYPRSSAMVLRSNSLVRVSLVEVGLPRAPDRQSDAGNEIFVELAIYSEAHTNARQVVVGNSRLEVRFAADPNVTAEAEATDQGLERAQLPAFVLGRGIHDGECALGLGGVGGGLIGYGLGLGGRLLGLCSRALGLIDARRCFLSGGVGLLGGVQQLLELGPQLVDQLVLLLDLLLLGCHGLFEVLDLFDCDRLPGRRGAFLGCGGTGLGGYEPG